MKTYPNTTVPRNAAVFTPTGDIAKVEPGYFASTAWLESDEQFAKITGRSFGWTDVFDTEVQYKDDKKKFIPLSQEKWNTLTDEQQALFTK